MTKKNIGGESGEEKKIISGEIMIHMIRTDILEPAKVSVLNGNVEVTKVVGSLTARKEIK